MPRRARRRRGSHGAQLQFDRRGIQAHQLEGRWQLGRGAESGRAPRRPGRRAGGRLFRRQPGADRGARSRAAEGSQAQGGVRQQEAAGREPRPAPPAAARYRRAVRRAAQAATQQIADGCAARRHQPGGARPRAAVRALQARRRRDATRVLRRAADRRESDRDLPRHGRIRERRRSAVAHRHAEGRQHRRRQGRQPDDGRDRPHLPLSRRRRDRRAAQVGEERREEMNARAGVLTLALAAALAGCSGEEHSDLKQELGQLTKDLRGRVDPLPQVKPYEPVPYTAEGQVDPFRPERIEVAQSGAGRASISKLAPDPNRPKEALEAFPLESIQMLGTITQKRETFALVKAGPNLYRVRKGNYLGQNFGVVTAVDEAQINIKELVQDGAGEWVERNSALQLVEAKR